MLYSEAVRGSQICMQTDLCSGSVKKKESFFGIFLQKGFLIQIRFRRQFSGEIFINLS